MIARRDARWHRVVANIELIKCLDSGRLGFLGGAWLGLPAAARLFVSFQQWFRATHWFRIAPPKVTRGCARVGPIRQSAKPACQGRPGTLSSLSIDSAQRHCLRLMLVVVGGPGNSLGARLAFEAGALIDRARVEPPYQPTAVQANDWAVSLILPGTSSALSRQSQCVGQESIRVAKGAADINDGDDS